MCPKFKFDINQLIICRKFDSHYYNCYGIILDRYINPCNEIIYRVKFNIDEDGYTSKIEYFYEYDLIELELDTNNSLTSTFNPLNTKSVVCESDQPIRINHIGCVGLSDNTSISKVDLEIEELKTVTEVHDGRIESIDGRTHIVEFKLDNIEKQQKKISKLSKLALLSRLI